MAKILFFDSEPEFTESFRQGLVDNGHDVTLAISAKEGTGARGPFELYILQVAGDCEGLDAAEADRGFETGIALAKKVVPENKPVIFLYLTDFELDSVGKYAGNNRHAFSLPALPSGLVKMVDMVLSG